MSDTEHARPMYQRSLIRAVQVHGGIKPFVSLLADAVEDFEMLFPCTVRALVSFNAEEDLKSFDTRLSALLLVARGYNVATSVTLVEHLRASFPDFNPDIVRLMSRDQLEREFGGVNAQLLVDTLCHPDTQPVLHELLFNQPDRALLKAVTRPHAEVVFRARVLREQFERSNDGSHPTVRWKLDRVEDVSLTRAQHVFHQVTEGGVLEAQTVLVPKNIFDWNPDEQAS